MKLHSRVLFTVSLIMLINVTAYADLNEIQFRNKTGNTIYYLFFSPGDSEFWGPDILGSEATFEPGDELNYYVSFSGDSTTFDFKAVDDEGNIYELYNMEIIDGEPDRIIISSDKLSETVDLEDFENGLVSLEIANATGFELYNLFISPADSDHYGIDFMDSETTLNDGDSVEVLMFVSGDGAEYDIMAVDHEDDSYSFQLSVDPEIVEQYVEIVLEDLD